ncbi:MAG: sodium:proline symporter [Eggerthellaceae bacterium]
MPAIYPSVALKNQQKEIKALADKEIVYITENGRGKYVFMSEDVLSRQIEDAVEDALYERRMTNALLESRADFEQGRCYSSREELLEAVALKRGTYATA